MPGKVIRGGIAPFLMSETVCDPWVGFNVAKAWDRAFQTPPALATRFRLDIPEPGVLTIGMIHPER